MKVPPPPNKGRIRTSRNVDPDDRRTQRGPNRKLGELLGITAPSENGQPDAETGLLPPFNETGGEREDGNHAEQWRIPAAWSYAGPGVDTEEGPLISADAQDRDRDHDVGVRGKEKMRQRLAEWNPFRRRKAVRWASLPAESAQNPFGDEHAIAGGGEDAVMQDEQMEMDTHDGPVPIPIPIPIPSTPSSSGQRLAFPFLAAARSVSAPTTPKRSPKRRTPGSSKSWLSEVSNTSGGGLSAAGSLRRRSVRRQARLSGGHEAQIRSMRKTVQVLGPEAASAVTKGTDVSPNKLRYMDFGRVLRQQMRRHL